MPVARLSGALSSREWLALLPLVALVFFYRGSLFKGFSISLAIPAATLLAAAVLFVPQIGRRGGVAPLPVAPAGLFLAWAASILVALATHPAQAGTTLRFGGELLLNGLLFYVGLAIARRGHRSMDQVLTLVVVASLPLALAMLALVQQMAVVRRVGAGEASLGVAVDHLGHAVAIAAIACTYKLMRQRDRPLTPALRVLLAGCVIVTVLAVILSGSKAALAALGFFAVGLALVGLHRHRRYVLHLGLGLVALIVLLGVALVATEGRFAPLASRFAPENFMAGVGERVEAMRSAAEGVGPADLLFGMPWRYEPLTTERPIRYPHNLLWSIWLHTGALPFLLFGYILLSRLGVLAGWAFGAREGWFRSVVLASMLLATVLYGFTSGRLTRIMTIFLVLGLVDGFIDQVRAAQSAAAPRALPRGPLGTLGHPRVNA